MIIVHVIQIVVLGIDVIQEASISLTDILVVLSSRDKSTKFAKGNKCLFLL
jgi:hypothetical protein